MQTASTADEPRDLQRILRSHRNTISSLQLALIGVVVSHWNGRL
jgi:hypothetical protein